MRARLPLYCLWIPSVVACLGLAYFLVDWDALPIWGEEVTEYRAPPPEPGDELVDDELKTKNPPFIAELVDRRPEGAWRVNSSAAVLRLDVPILKPDADSALFALRPSYFDAMAEAPSRERFLPSINVIDGKAKQFDDGLFAAIDRAYYHGLKPRLPSLVGLIERLYRHIPPGSDASAYVAAGLRIAGRDVKPSQPDRATSWMNRFESTPRYARPFGFYTWSEELRQVFRFMRFFQQPLPQDDGPLVLDLARAAAADQALLEDFKRVNAFYARLTNPLVNLGLSDVLEKHKSTENRPSVAVFPTSRSKETELIGRLFPDGLPLRSDLMREIVRAIRQGKIDLAPKSDSGWYEYQIHALETFLLPENGPEHAKLLLTKSYKKRMLEAFQALMTKRRETHSRTLESKSAGSIELSPPLRIAPRLRVEPCPTYFLRMARSYDFLLNFLAAAIGEDGLASLHGLKEGGERKKALFDELRWIRGFFYGLHLLSAEDIGMAPDLHRDEPVDRPACEAIASAWLTSYADDPDLKVDTRVAVPIYFDLDRRRTRLWATLGVRLAKLSVSYARPPRIRPVQGSSEWQAVDPGILHDEEYLIAVDDFAEIEIPGLQPLTRQELRDVCDRYKTRPEILPALSRDAP